MMRKFLFGTILLLAVLAVGTRASASPVFANSTDMQPDSQLSSQNQFVEEFPVDVSPLNLVTSAPGEVWFTAPDSNLIGRLVVTSTTDFEVQKFTVPTSASQPYDLAYKAGIVWFSEKAGNKIGKLNTNTGTIDEFVIPTANSQPKGIAVAPDGSIWFAESNSNKLGKFDPANGTFQEYLYTPSNAQNAQMEDLAIETDGDVWISSPVLHRAIFFSISRNQFFIVPTGLDSKPIGITVDARNELWIGIQQPSSVGRYAPGTLALWRWFLTPTSNSAPTGVTSFKIGNQIAIAYAEQSTNQVGLLILNSNSALVTHLETVLPTAGGLPWGVTTDSQGTIWVAASGTNAIAHWNAPYLISTPVVTPTSIPTIENPNPVVTPLPIPEPITIVLLSTGLATLSVSVAFRRRRDESK